MIFLLFIISNMNFNVINCNYKWKNLVFSSKEETTVYISGDLEYKENTTIYLIYTLFLNDSSSNELCSLLGYDKHFSKHYKYVKRQKYEICLVIVEDKYSTLNMYLLHLKHLYYKFYLVIIF